MELESIPALRIYIHGTQTAIAEASKGVRRELEEVTRQAGKRGPYVILSSSQRCEIAKYYIYADQYGAAETARHTTKSNL